MKVFVVLCDFWNGESYEDSYSYNDRFEGCFSTKEKAIEFINSKMHEYIFDTRKAEWVSKESESRKKSYAAELAIYEEAVKWSEDKSVCGLTLTKELDQRLLAAAKENGIAYGYITEYYLFGDIGGFIEYSIKEVEVA